MRARRFLAPAVIGLAALLVAVAVPLYAVKVAHKFDYTDFEVYYRAASRVKHGQWDQVYTMADGASPFRYAPVFLPFFRPFAELSLAQARLAWYFVQVLWFALGFFCLERALRLTRRGHGRVRGREPQRPLSLALTAATLLFVLRFCLDCFTIGQVSSLLFLGYCASLWAWMSRRPGWAGSALLVPSMLKIGPGFLFSLFAAAPKPRERVRAIGIPLLWFAASVAFLRLWAGGGATRFRMLWTSWVEIVANDSVYYDASHYGSQSIKSALLRAVNSGRLTAGHAHAIYLATVVLGCAALFGFWLTRRPVSRLGRGAFFALGVFPYLWFMPETFKYSLTALAVPIALLLARPKPDRLTRFALVFAALTLSVAGLDIVGARLFFGLQRASVPLVATLLLGWAALRLAVEQSVFAWDADSRSSAPWPETPGMRPELELTLLVPLPMQSVSVLHPSWIRRLVGALREELGPLLGSAPFEILLIPFGNRASRLHPAWQEAQSLAATFPEVVLLEAASAPQRGSALRDGFLRARGRQLACLDVEQPCETAFFARARECLSRGQADIVRANRRHPESRFRIPVRYLPLVYGRHRLGLLFNRLVRFALPITTTDTHSGSWLMDRQAALPIFALQKSPGFLFDLEAWITASQHGLRAADLPVTIFLSQEKSARRVGREAWTILRGIPMLWLRYRAGCYSPRRARPQGITADDWGITPGVNHGILELARLGVVRRVSMMAHAGYLLEGLDELKAIPELSLGLHFDLTLGKSPPGRVLKHWLRARASGGRELARLQEEARSELRAQLGVLRAAGVRPTHLDGHHHIHLVPGMLDALAPVIREAGIRQVRLPADPALLWRKPALWLLTRLAARDFRRLGFESLPCFYPQARHFGDQGRLRLELGRNPQAEVIVHPASENDLPRLSIPDSYTTGRVTEYRALRMLSFSFLPEAVQPQPEAPLP